MTIEIETPEQVHDAVPTAANELQTAPANGLIKFDIARADIEHMKAEAAGLTIAGPEDKAGFDLVYRLRLVVKRQRVAVEKKGKELKAPHITYNRQVDAAMKELTDEMDKIEDGLAHKEKVYNDERERIAREKMLAQQQRTEGRVNVLRGYGFAWNVGQETYDFIREEFALHLRINFDDIKELSDEDYRPIGERAGWIYESEQTALAEVKRLADEYNARIAAEQQAERERYLADKKALDEERAQVRAKEIEADRIIREQYDREAAEQMKRDRAAALAQEEADYLRREKEAEAQQKVQRKADRERRKRLASDCNLLHKAFVAVGNSSLPIPTQPEAIELRIQYIGRLHQLTKEFTDRLATL